MLRIGLFLATNLAVILLVHLVMSIFGIENYTRAQGLNYGSLLVFAALFGFIGSFVSLAMSKWVAKRSVGARVLDGTEGVQAQWLVQTTHALADRAGIGRPEVAIFQGEPNAFATGANRNNALVAVSDGLIQSMSQDEVEAVLAHEVAHIANGDMITMSLLQGVLNTFVIFLSRVVAHIIDNFLRGDDEEGSSMGGMAYFITVIALEMVFGLLASIIAMWFSRLREYRADASAAQLMGSPEPMIRPLSALERGRPSEGLPSAVSAFGIRNKPAFAALFASHPQISDRIARLQGR